LLEAPTIKDLICGNVEMYIYASFGLTKPDARVLIAIILALELVKISSFTFIDMLH